MSAPNDLTLRQFFLNPSHPRQRQYEALRGFFVEGLSSAEAATKFGYDPAGFRVLCHHFRRDVHEREFFSDPARGPQSQPNKDRVRERIVALRKLNYSVYDIQDELQRKGPGTLSPTAIREVLRDEGFSRLPRRADDERPDRPRPVADAIADVRNFALEKTTFTTHVGGVFLLLPLIAQLRLDELADRSALPGSKMIPAGHALRAALLLKLIGKSRRSHVMDTVFDPGVALAAGLNTVPKATFMWQYSTRVGRSRLASLLGEWVEHLRSLKVVDAESFNLDFHSIRYFGESPEVEKHYVPTRSQRTKSMLTFLAQDESSSVLCYSNTDLRKGEESDEVIRFVRFWERKYGERPKHLVFDSKLTTFSRLSRLNGLGITFITLRRRSPALTRRVVNAAAAEWKTITLDVPGRKYKTPRILEEIVSIPEYRGTVRQFLIADLGHEEPTVLITNDKTSSPSAIITRYARRMLIENGLADCVDFFHLDALSSAVALNVDFDVLMTLIGSAVYRQFAQKLRGYEHAHARQIFRHFLDTTARITTSPAEVRVELPRRAHNPLLIDAGIFTKSHRIPWWNNAQLTVSIV